jgi:HD-like signal output (HDOD) protein
MELDLLLSREPVLPSMPKVVALLLSELDQAQPDLRKLCQLFSADPALTLQLLRLAHEAERPHGLGVSSIAQALALLEVRTLKQVAAAAASALAAHARADAIALPQFWRYSVHVAKLARALAASVRHNQATAYTAGLVHAIGELVLYAELPHEMALLDQSCGPFDLRRAKMEQRRLGFGYANVGAALVQRWCGQPLLVDALRHQNSPFENDAYEPLAGIVHLAVWRARAVEAGLDERALATSFPGEVGLALGLDIDMVLQQDPIDWSDRDAPSPLH